MTARSNRRISARRARRSRGQTLAEFALVIPVLIVMLMGIFDLGRAIFAYNAITNAAREGARLGIVNQWADKIIERAINMAPTADQDTDAVTVAISKSTSAPDDDDCAACARRRLHGLRPLRNRVHRDHPDHRLNHRAVDAHG